MIDFLGPLVGVLQEHKTLGQEGMQKYIEFVRTADKYRLYFRLPLYTSDAADDPPCVDPGGRRNIKKKNNYLYKLLAHTSRHYNAPLDSFHDPISRPPPAN